MDVHRIFLALEEQPVKPCLFLVKTDSKKHREVEMTPVRDGIVIGRSPKADWAFPEDDVMSRRHFEIRKEEQEERREWWIRDLASENGLWGNGRKVNERRLVHGDQIRAGSALFLYHDGMPPPQGPATIG
jgi:predicted component of type VI protein secretion system